MGGQGGGPRRGARRHTRAVRFAGRPLDNSELWTGLPYLATTSEARRHARCAAAPRSEFRACEREQGVSFSRASGGFLPLRLPPSITSERWRPSPYSPWLWTPPLEPRLLVARSFSPPILRWSRSQPNPARGRGRGRGRGRDAAPGRGRGRGRGLPPLPPPPLPPLPPLPPPHLPPPHLPPPPLPPPPLTFLLLTFDLSACDLSDCGIFTSACRPHELGVLHSIDRGGALGASLRKFALPTPRFGQLAKICTGNLTGSGLRKYALRQNHTIPV